MCAQVYGMCVRETHSVGEAQSGIAPCENDLLPVSPLSNGLLFSDVWRREGEVLRGVWGGVDVARLMKYKQKALGDLQCTVQ